MSVPTGAFFSQETFVNYFGTEDLFENRFENDGNGNPIYIGFSVMPNADVDLPIWFILKVEYTGTAIIRKRLPDDGIKLGYAWSQRATYFS